jgi:hypothetical protein
MLRKKLEPKIDTLIGEQLQDSNFLAKVLRAYHQRLASLSSPESPGVDRVTILQKLDELRAKKDRVLETFFDGVIDRIRRDDALRKIEREIDSYNLLLGTPSLGPQPLIGLDAMLRVVEPLADWQFISREDRRALLRHLCPEICIYRYTVKSLTLNVGANSQSSDGHTTSHSKMAP